MCDVCDAAFDESRCSRPSSSGARQPDSSAPDLHRTSPTATRGSSMRDPRIDKLARVLVHYSAVVSDGDVVAIRGGALAQPLLLAVHDEVLKAGGHPLAMVGLEGAAESLYLHGSDAQLDF